MTITFYHNPRCSKSRAVNALLEESGKPYELVEYLKTPFSRDQLCTMIEHLDSAPAALIRTSDSAFKALGTPAGELDRERVIDLLLSHPELFQRPVVVSNNGARIGRPPESVLEIL